MRRLVRSPLARFWAILLLSLAIGGAVLQVLGPPRPRVAFVPGKAEVAGAARPPAVVAAPDPAFREPSAEYPGGFLPRIGPDGRHPSSLYAAHSDPGEHRPKVAIVIAGIGMSAADSEAAIDAMPAAVTLVVSPYTVDPDRLLARARARGHEYLVAIPMEPKRYPLDDPGNRALLTGNTPGVNEQHLMWALTRFGGYVGATAALGALRGERFEDSPSQMAPVLAELKNRGLLYFDPNPSPAPAADTIVADIVLDETPGGPEIDARLTRLEQAARDRGVAIGLMSVPRPVALDRLAAWLAGLDQRGLALVPLTAAKP